MCTNPISGVIVLVLVPLIGSIAWLALASTRISVECEITKCSQTSRDRQGCEFNITATWSCENVRKGPQQFIHPDSCVATCSLLKNASKCYVGSCDDEKVSIERSESNDKLYFIIVASVSGIFFAFAIFYSVFERLIKKILRKLRSFTSRRPSPTEDEESPSLRRSQFVQDEYHVVTPPPAVSPTASTRRINHEKIKRIFDNLTVPHEELKQLRTDGWSCCICLEEADEAESPEANAVLRLRCNHYVHTECMRGWVDKGHTVCCLCKDDILQESQ